jgi:peptidoglycan-associated lipoprotein
MCLGTILAAALALVPSTHAQEPYSVDLAATYSTERGRIATIDCGCFWKQGGSIDAAITFSNGVGIAVNLTGDRNDNFGSGLSLSEISFMAGLRYTRETHRWTDRILGSSHPSSFFGEALFGFAHGFDATFPAGAGLASSVNANSLQLGGGMNIALAKGFGARAFELDYVRTTLPNGGNNIQNNFRLSFGITYNLHRLK